MGFWDLMDSMSRKADKMKSNYIHDVEEKSKKILNNPSAYSKEQLKKAEKNRDKIRDMRKREFQSPEPNEIEGRYDNYEAEQAKLIAQNKYSNCTIKYFLSSVPFWPNIGIYDKIADEGMPDDQKEFLDGLGISHSYYARISTLRELYRVLSNPLAREFIRDRGKGNISEFSEYIEAQVCEGVSEVYDDKLAAFSSLTDEASEVIKCVLEEEYPVPEVDDACFIPLLIYADNGLENLNERGFVIYGFCKYSGDNLQCEQFLLFIKNSEDDYCFFPLAEIYKIESKPKAVIINDQYTIRTSRSKGDEFGEYNRSQVLAYILNLFMLEEWAIRGDYSLMSIKLQQISSLANTNLANKVFFDEDCFLEFLMGTQDS